MYYFIILTNKTKTTYKTFFYEDEFSYITQSSNINYAYMLIFPILEIFSKKIIL
jgi:hypothetical protein